MRIEMVRAFCEVVARELSITRAAAALDTSQPNVTKQIRMLEAEIGAALFVRRGGRILGLTKPGENALEVARRMLRDAGNLRRIGEDHSAGARGSFTIATTHFIARYLLADTIAAFHANYPDVHIILRETTQRNALDMLQSARADIGVLGQPPHGRAEVAQLQSRRQIGMSVVARRDHPLASADRIRLEDIAAHQVVLLDPVLSGGWQVKQAFDLLGLEITPSLTASNLELVKAYVAKGLGVAILPTLCVEPERDTDLVVRPAPEAVRESSPFIAVHPETTLRDFVYDFISIWSPEWTKARVNRHIKRMVQSTKRVDKA